MTGQDMTLEQLEAIKTATGHRCEHCGSPVRDRGGRVTVPHLSWCPRWSAQRDRVPLPATRHAGSPSAPAQVDWVDLVDLPASWEGRPVLWAGWQPVPDHALFVGATFGEGSGCTRCGAHGRPTGNRALVGVRVRFSMRRLLAEEKRLRADEKRRRRLGPMAEVRTPAAWWRLLAYRCPACRLDTVWDLETDQWWIVGSGADGIAQQLQLPGGHHG